MDLILWRHAEADEGVPDIARELTDKGHRQADQMAHWLKARLPKDTQILVSHAARAQQTAHALTSQFETSSGIGPGASHSALLAAAGWPNRNGAVLLVGHQPTLGQVAARLLSGRAAEWSIKKGAIWWFTQRGADEHVVLRVAMSPDLV
ncbi:MAG: histidine phosphatase family protein [Betaproteobacteria bacterium]